MRRRWPWGRSAAVGLALLTALASAGAARPEATLEMRSERPGVGFAGSLKRDGVGLVFESYATPTGAVSRICSASGEVLTEIIVDKQAGIFEYLVGGVALSGETTDEDAERAMRTFERADAALAAEHLLPALVRKLRASEPRALAALAANLTGYTAVPRGYSPNSSKAYCLGCCGPSCWGCTGCYTQACLAHDLCAGFYGHASSRCLRLLYLAALSAWCCQDVDMGSLC
jgi:hypothetical protein